jgi:hypothetical protein
MLEKIMFALFAVSVVAQIVSAIVAVYVVVAMFSK